MADNFTVVITGVPEAMREIRGWQGRLVKRVKKVVLQYTLLIEGEAKRLAPVDTGRLRASIHHELEHVTNIIVGRVLSGVDYAIHQEFGTVFQAGKAHMRPAFEKYKDAFVRAIIDAIEKA